MATKGKKVGNSEASLLQKLNFKQLEGLNTAPAGGAGGAGGKKEEPVGFRVGFQVVPGWIPGLIPAGILGWIPA